VRFEKQKFKNLLRQVFQSAVDHDKFVEMLADALGRSKATIYRRLEDPSNEDMIILELLEKVPRDQWPIRWQTLSHQIDQLMTQE